MPSTSSLLKSAEATRQKIRDYEDALIAYEWQNSTKTYGDYRAYEQFLASRMDTASPMDRLSYQKKIDSARSGYISNEIQRQSISVIEGNSSSIDKYNRMLGLHYTAAEAGQYDLAQSLRLQLDNLSVTIQNEQRAALSANKEAASAYAKEIDNMVSDTVTQVQSYANDFLKEYSQLGPEGFTQEYGSDIFTLLSNMVNSQDPNSPGIVQVLQQAAGVTPDPDKIRAYQQKLNDLANGGGTGIKLPGIKEDISYKDLIDQANANLTGQTLFTARTTANGVEFSKNKTTGYAWGRKEDGTYDLMPIYNANQNRTSKVAGDKDGEMLTYDTLLKNAQFEIVANSDGRLVVVNNGQFDAAGIPRGQQVELYTNVNGELQLVNGKKSYVIDFDSKTRNFTGLRAEEANPINLLPSGTQQFSRFNNPYFAGKDLSGLPAGTIGLIDTTSPIARSMEAGPLASPQLNPQQSGMAPAPMIQPQPVAPITPQAAASPLGLPAIPKLAVARPLPTPKLTVSRPAPTPNVSVAPPQQGGRVNIGVAQPYSGQIRVGF